MFRSFYRRILILLVALVVFAQITSFVAVLTTLDKDVRADMHHQLDEGARQLLQLLRKRHDMLLASTEVLAADFGFRSAIASKDVNTIHSALVNSIARVNADMASLIAPSGELISSTHAYEEDATVYARAIDRARAQERHVDTLMIAGQARKIVVVPVKAPLTIGWLLLGFSLDDTLAEDMGSQLGMEVSFSDQTDGYSRFFGSTLPMRQRQALPDALGSLEESSSGFSALLGGESFLTHVVKLGSTENRLHAALQLSLQEALASYRLLRKRLILLAAVSLGLALCMAFWLAHNVTRPLSQLSGAAARIRDGDYSHRLDLHRSDEIGQLATTFNRMQDGIADREKHIVHQAHHDELTGLPNLLLARIHLQEFIHSATPTDDSVAVMIISVDRFRQVIETLGHPVGDRLLVQIAQRIRSRVRESDTVARIAGDEFLILCPGAGLDAIHRLADDVNRQMAEPVSLDAATLIPSVSIGVSIYPQHGAKVNDLIRRANIALTDARDAFSQVQLYKPGRDDSHLRRLSLVADLKRAVEENELLMHYQPKISVHDNRVYAVEALVRWIHPQHGFMPPGEFISLAENSGNIGMLSNWVLHAVVAQLAQWHSRGVCIAAAINLSAMDLQDDSLPERVCACLQRYGLPLSSLIIEVTESAMMRDADKAMQTLQMLRAQGIITSIDDFGTGYSSLAKLRDLAIDELKIDRSFIIDIKPDTTDAFIVKSIIELGHSMGMKITTEGIETESEWNLIRALGTDTVQGYYICRPLPAEDFINWWQEHNLHADARFGFSSAA